MDDAYLMFLNGLHVKILNLTARNAGLMATQHTLQNNPGALPSMAWTSLQNLLIPESNNNNKKSESLTVFVFHVITTYLILRVIGFNTSQSIIISCLP